MPQVAKGKKIPLYMFLEDKDPAKFVEAVVKDQDGGFIAASVSMTSVGDGSYVDYSVTMPGTAEFAIAEFTVFDDAAFLVESVIHFPTAELYEIDAAVDEIKQSIEPQLAGITPPGSSLSVEFDAGEMEAEIEIPPAIDAEVAADEILVDLTNDQTIDVDTDQEGVDAEMECDK